ncbi:MAG TPA: hypothetical protein VGY55_24585 [Pirellulales bacterium]|jgi:uncharacterized protein GlcG (DUF336 family)|nr:hypothetical protein [Pirellulales bacterium]
MAKSDRVRGRKLSIERLEPRLALNAQPVITPSDVNSLLQRAAAAASRNDAIIAVVDRNGSILGVKVESGVSVSLQGQPVTPANQLNALVFAIDGAVAEARTAALFSNNNAPLTSRTIRFISQSTITQREVQSDPDLNDLTSPYQGPGLIAPVGLGGEFPAGIMNTPQVDLFGIELTNRDSLLDAGADGIKGTADDIVLPNRFNIPTANLALDPTTLTPITLVAPESYGYVSQILVDSQSRGVATLPGGVPLFKNGVLVGAIGVFFPGPYGYADFEQTFNTIPSNNANAEAARENGEVNSPYTDLAEWMAFAAAGGTRATAAGQSGLSGALFPVHTVGGVPEVSGYGLPLGQINLAGITLDIYGPNGPFLGVQELRHEASIAGVGNPNSSLSLGAFNPGNSLALDSLAHYATGTPVPDGWLVVPHGTDVAGQYQIIKQGVLQAMATRAQIRLPLGTPTAMVFSVSDLNGNLLALYRMPDATVFSIDVAVAKSRNDAYYDDPAQLISADMVSNTPGGPAVVPAGTAFSSRTYRFLAEPRYPIGTSGTPPGPFSSLIDPGIDPTTGDTIGTPLPASAYSGMTTSVLGFAAFNPNRNFRDPNNIANQDGVVFFPGSSPLYIGGVITFGLGVSGDGVDQDDVVTAAAMAGFAPVPAIRADQFFVRGVRLPFMSFDRNPQG